MKYFTMNRLKAEVLQSAMEPKRAAASLALGVFMAFSPFPGLHLILAFVAIKLFRMKAMLVIFGVMVHNPWTMIFIHFSGLMIGDLLLSGELASLNHFQQIPWRETGFFAFFSKQWWVLNGPHLRAIFIPFFFGSLVGATVFATVTYKTTLFLLKRSHGQHGERPTP